MADGGNDFKNGLFGCFGDARLCIISFLIPCYTIGKSAEVLGEDCLMVGLLTALGINMYPIIRWRVRQEKNIQGSMLMDVLCVMFCPCCVIIQDARELGWHDKGNEKEQEMTRE